MTTPISLPKTFSSFTETWSPHLVASVNDQHVKIAKLDGAFVFHAHPDSDELFYVLEGDLTMEVEVDAGEGQRHETKKVEAVIMKPGDMYNVPKGVRHRPVAKNAHVIMVEKAGTVNTGDVEDSERRREPVDVR
ncbi:RmlC-like cupin domain-containing protein [Xylariaceae sp. FL0255]|nr:RmlC-like cupin domain-containing protein [Xylariaceae sp. FL0255]